MAKPLTLSNLEVLKNMVTSLEPLKAHPSGELWTYEVPLHGRVPLSFSMPRSQLKAAQ